MTRPEGTREYRKTATVHARQAQPGEVVRIETLEGPAGAEPGDWIVTAATERGEQWIVKAGVFEATYEPVEDQAPEGGKCVCAVHGEPAPFEREPECPVHGDTAAAPDADAVTAIAKAMQAALDEHAPDAPIGLVHYYRDRAGRANGYDVTPYGRLLGEAAVCALRDHDRAAGKVTVAANDLRALLDHGGDVEGRNAAVTMIRLRTALGGEGR